MVKIVSSIFQSNIYRPDRFHILCIKARPVQRSFSSTDWTKPKFIYKPYCDPELGKVKSSGFLKFWRDLQYQFIKAGQICNGRGPAVLASARLGERKPNFIKHDCNTSESDSKTQSYKLIGLSINTATKWLIDRKHIGALYGETMSKLAAAFNLNDVKALPAGDVILNATTANSDQGGELSQKLETIGEVPLVEAEPDKKKPDKTFAPNVMNVISPNSKDFEEAKHSDFQGLEDTKWKKEKPKSQAHDKPSKLSFTDYFNENQKSELDVAFSAALPEVKADEDIPLSEMLKRVRQRNRLLRCREIEVQFKMAGYDGPHPHPSSPQWMPYQPSMPYYHPQYHQPHYNVPRQRPPKAEPLTPDNRPPTRNMQNPINMALHLGPLVYF